MTSASLQRRAPALSGVHVSGLGTGIARGTLMGYLSFMVLLPLAAVVWKSTNGGWSTFWGTISTSDSLASLELTLLLSLGVAGINAVTGTLLAWVLIRDRFPGRQLVDAVIDLPFALPTIVAGLTLLALYGPNSPIGVDAAYSRWAILLALLFVTLPFVVRSVQPVLAELDRDAEEAAASLGAGGWTIFRRIILPALLPAAMSGAGLGFARAIGEFGSVVLISGNIPYNTEVASVHIYGQIQSDNVAGAAALSVVLLAVSLFVMLVLRRLERRAMRHAQ